MADSSLLARVFQLFRRRVSQDFTNDMARDIEMRGRPDVVRTGARDPLTPTESPGSTSDSERSRQNMENALNLTKISHEHTKSTESTLVNRETTSFISFKLKDDGSRRELSVLYGAIVLRLPVLFPQWTKDERYENQNVEKIDDYPPGYPRFAATLNSDPNFSVYRRFGTLRNRILLYRQQELAKLETKLLELDRADESSEDPSQKKRLKSWKLDEKAETERFKLITVIDDKLKAYDNLLDREQRSLAMMKPTKRNRMSIVHWVWNYRELLRSETQFLNPIDDFVSLAGEQDSDFYVFLESLASFLPIRVHKFLLSSKELREKTSAKGIDLMSKERFLVIIRIVVALLTVMLLLTPICILYNVEVSNPMKMLVIGLFVVAFPVIVTVFARPKNHELFAVTAAYAAVLVVFLGNIAAAPDAHTCTN